MPGRPYSFVAALESGRTSWCALPDAVRLGLADDATAVTAAQLRDVVERLTQAEHWRPGDPEILIVMDSGDAAAEAAWMDNPCEETKEAFASVGAEPCFHPCWRTVDNRFEATVGVREAARATA